MKHEIAIYRSLSLDASQGYATLCAVLDAIVQKKAPYERTTLTVSFEGLGPPFSGRVSVPVKLTARHNEMRYESAITISGAAASAIFPTFEGTLSINPLRELGSELWLQGNYVAPLGAAGEIIDRTLLNNAAQTSLGRMLDWIANEITRNVAQEAS